MRVSTGLWTYEFDPVVPNLPDDDSEVPFVFNVLHDRAEVGYTIRAADKFGSVIGEMPYAILDSITWGADGSYGMAVLILPVYEAEGYREMLSFGGRVQIDFTGGVPSWVGVIDPPTETTPLGTRVQLYEASYTLVWSMTESDDLYEGADALTAAMMLTRIAREYATNMQVPPPRIDGGDAYSLGFQNRLLNGVANDIRAVDVNMHYRVVPAGSGNHHIDFKLDVFYGSAGRGQQSARILQDYNLLNWSVLVQGNLVNRIVAGSGVFIGSGEPGVTPPVVHDYGSATAYGSRSQMIIVQSDSVDELRHRANSLLDRQAHPRTRVAGMVVNLGPGSYDQYRVGSDVIVEVYEPDAAQFVWMIIGMSLAMTTKTLSLIFDDSEVRRET